MGVIQRSGGYRERVLPPTPLKLPKKNGIRVGIMRKNVLVLDDEPTNRSVIAFVLRAVGYDVLEADTGTAALRVGHGRPIMVLVADLRLPDMPGTDVARRLRQDWPEMGILF